MTAVIDPLLACGAILGVCGFGGMALLLAIQCHHTATAIALTEKAQKLAAHRGDQVLELIDSNQRLRSLLAREADQHAERLADLVSVCGAATPERPEKRMS